MQSIEVIGAINDISSWANGSIDKVVKNIIPEDHQGIGTPIKVATVIQGVASFLPLGTLIGKIIDKINCCKFENIKKFTDYLQKLDKYKLEDLGRNLDERIISLDKGMQNEDKLEKIKTQNSENLENISTILNKKYDYKPNKTNCGLRIVDGTCQFFVSGMLGTLNVFNIMDEFSTKNTHTSQFTDSCITPKTSVDGVKVAVNAVGCLSNATGVVKGAIKIVTGINELCCKK